MSNYPNRVVRIFVSHPTIGEAKPCEPFASALRRYADAVLAGKQCLCADDVFHDEETGVRIAAIHEQMDKP